MQPPSPNTALTGGFDQPPQQSARAFRAIMTAMAQPGRIERVSGASAPAPMSGAAAVLALTLFDATTPIHLAGRWDCAAVRDWITFHTSAPFTGPAQCSFALGDWAALIPLSAYPIGTAEYPDRSATLIVELDRLEPSGAQLQGPGIRESAALSLPEIAAFQTNAKRFPLGLDFYFTQSDNLAALPRSTTVRAD